MCYNVSALCVNMFFIGRLWEDIVDKTIYEVLKTDDLPFLMKIRIKFAKTEKAIANILFDYNYAELVGEHFLLKESNRYFNEWKNAANSKADARYRRAIGRAQKFGMASEYRNRIRGKIEYNEEGLRMGRIIRRQKRRSQKDEE